MRAVLRTVRTGDQFEFLNRIDADVVDERTHGTMIDVANAIERRRSPATKTVNRSIVGANVGSLLRVIAYSTCPWSQINELSPVAAIQRNFRNLRAGD